MAALVFDRVTKDYRGARGYRALRDDLSSLLRRRREPRPVVRALDDVSLEIREGESFGLIGPNGAGKTTALKLATRITYPTRGEVRVRGRVGALIEVGTGLHPELTGRENIGLYGRILGFSGADVARRFDEIVEFAGISGAIDQPVKQYSSGMTLRLGFSVAAHLEPDVLLVDEAISVGDAGFQHRCVERMAELVRQGGTLIFVSHDMSAIETLCSRVVLLDHGRIVASGPARQMVYEYLRGVESARLSDGGGALGELLEIDRVSLHDASGVEIEHARAGEPLTIRLHYRTPDEIRRPLFSVGLSDGRQGCFTLASMLIDGDVPDSISGEGHIDCSFGDLPLFPKVYEIWGSVRGEAGFGDILNWQRLRLFRVAGELSENGKGAVSHSLSDAPVRLPYTWWFGR
jgi:ABC-type polysaccharide/polyol phosphate transport system ATPase subunit